jgi:hypothetical protein
LLKKGDGLPAECLFRGPIFFRLFHQVPSGQAASRHERSLAFRSAFQKKETPMGFPITRCASSVFDPMRTQHV